MGSNAAIQIDPVAPATAAAGVLANGFRQMLALAEQRLLAWVERRRQQRLAARTVRILHGLGDHVLADIGVHRSGIRAAVSERMGHAG